MAHAALAAVLLALAATWIGTGSSFTSDEGASVLQAHAIEHGRWVVPDPLANADPSGAHYPIELSAQGAGGFAPLGKHLFYGVVLAAVDRVGRTNAMVALSLFGTVAAALLAAALAREIVPGAERLTLWFVAFGTPLLFDGFLIVAQALAAALVAGSVLLALRFLERGGPWRLVAMAACSAGACLLRTEAVLWCFGLAVAALTIPGRVKRGWLRALSVAGVAIIGGGLAREADSFLTRRSLGAAQSVLGAPASGHSPADQLHAFFASWLQATTDPFSTIGAWIVGALVAIAVTGRMMVRGRYSSWGLLAVATGSVIVWAARLLPDPTSPVSGLAAAAPVLWVGIWLVERPLLRVTSVRLCLVASGVFAVLVLATQYSDGGGAQWGGRFFAIGLPAVAPVAIAAIGRQRHRLGRRTAMYLSAAGVALTLLTAVGAIASLHASHRMNSHLASAIERSASEAPAAGDGGRPVFITAYGAVPRLEWQVFDDVRWQLVRVSEMASAGKALRGIGISTFTLVTTDPQFQIPAFSQTFTAADAREVQGVKGWYLVRFRAN